MRIAIVNSHYYPDEHGGAERSLRFLAEAAVARGHQCTVFTTGDTRESTELNGVGHRALQPSQATRGIGRRACQADVAPAGHVQLRGRGGDGQRDSALRRRMSRTPEQPFGISVALWGCLRRMGIPIAHTLRDYYLICPNTAQFRNGVSCGSRCGACRRDGRAANRGHPARRTR